MIPNRQESRTCLLSYVQLVQSINHQLKGPLKSAVNHGPHVDKRTSGECPQRNNVALQDNEAFIESRSMRQWLIEWKASAGWQHARRLRSPSRSVWGDQPASHGTSCCLASPFFGSRSSWATDVPTLAGSASELIAPRAAAAKFHPT